MIRELIITTALVFLCFQTSLYSQDDNPAPAPESQVDEEETADKNGDRDLNVNIDARLLYGQYNTIDTAASVTQNFDAFTYRLNSELLRSNDFSYKNSSFYESKTGFTGSAGFGDKWVLRPELEVDNESHGMHRNPVFRREEKDRVGVELKTNYQPAPSTFDFDFGGTYMVHRLSASQSLGIKSSNFNKFYGRLSWEYVLSAANRIHVEAEARQYDYPHGSNNDTSAGGEILLGFKIAENYMISLGPVYRYNRDYGHLPSGKINISTTGLKYNSIEISYIYDLRPFKPEELYFDQKHVLPNYRMPPDRVHNARLKYVFQVRNKKEKNFYVQNFMLKGTGDFEKNSEYYNFLPITFFPGQGYILTPRAISLLQCTARGDIILDMFIRESFLRLGLNYQYFYFYANDNITYRPVHSAGGNLKLSINRFEIEWDNTLIEKVYIHPHMNLKLARAVIGTVNLQIKMLETFYLFAKIDNVYGYKYYFLYGYPEPGRTFTGGLRIII